MMKMSNYFFPQAHFLINLMHSHANFVSADDEGNFAAPGIDETGPAGVYGNVLSITSTEADRVVKRLASILQDWWDNKKDFIHQ